MDDGYGNEDDELVLAAQRDPARFDVLYHRYHGDIHAFVRSRVEADATHIEDLVSRVFTKALAGLPSFRAGSFRGWLYRIARNVVIDDLRIQRPTIPIDNVVHLTDRGPRPDDRVMQRMLHTALRESLDVLSPTQRAVIDLRLLGMTAPQIADHLGMNTEAVKSAQYRAFERLLKHFKETGQVRREDL